MVDSLIVPKSEPFFFPGSRTGCLLLHGFTSMPEEMRLLGECLNEQGYTVLGLRLSGHATHPWDLARTHWKDWLIDVEEGLAILRPVCDRIFIIGQSMGGMVALLSAARYPVAGVVALSTPYDLDEDWRSRTVRLWSFFIPIIFKGLTPIYDPRSTRREKDYPAYPYFPTRILAEVEDLKREMRSELSRIAAPVLIIQSRKDPGVSPQNAEHLYAALQTSEKELFFLEQGGHSIALDPQCEPAFDKVCQFLKKETSF
jgi:carboxylesterase